MVPALAPGIRVAVFGDIHGNLPALTAALGDMARQGVRAHLCLGDVAMDGPWPAECLVRIAALGCPVVRGNADRLLLESDAPFIPRGFPDERRLHDIGLWSRHQIGPAERQILDTFKPLVEWPDLLCFHGSPARDNEELTDQTPTARLQELRSHFGQQAVWIGGHTHQPLSRPLADGHLLNPGSVGLPFVRRGSGYVNVARADYLILERQSAGWTAHFRQVPYDVQDVRRGILSRRLPHAQWLAAEWVSAAEA